ncbi:hypothetical protein GQ607_001353 [Colletotrichum asianum]|uniref:Uncharacterized protein n=1 Tax=Colletotrichum asianum TaxID=702518 RepID=A0A8H3WUW3_9PEZI|nr:hypothetical protein GQ607_001353 [Colletotrichum asianum]
MRLAPCIWANCASANPMACSPPSSHDSALAAPRDERLSLSCRPTRRSRRWQSVSNKILLSQSKLSCTHYEMILQGFRHRLSSSATCQAKKKKNKGREEGRRGDAIAVGIRASSPVKQKRRAQQHSKH